MSRAELERLDRDARDPAVTLLLLLPLGLLNLAGRSAGDAISLVETGLQRLGAPADLVLGSALAIALVWAIGRVQKLGLAWRGGSVLTIGEGLLWGVVLGPALHALTLALPLDQAPLVLQAVDTGEGPGLGERLLAARQAIAVAAGAGLYEEVLFRGLLFGGMAIVLRGLFHGVGWPGVSRRLAWTIALILSSALFAWAHVYTDPQALEPQILTFRFLAGMTFGGLFLWRGLAVVAWAHAGYDALLLLS